MMLVCCLLTFIAIFSAGYLSPNWIFILSCAVAIYFLVVHSRLWQPNSTVNEVPRVSAMLVLKQLYYEFKDRKRAKTLIFELIFGSCLLFPKEGMHILSIMTKDFLVLHHPKATEFLLSSRTILRKGFVYNIMFKDWLKDGLIMSYGKKWYYRRKLCKPAFRLKTINEFFPFFNKHAEILVLRISELMENKEAIDIRRLVSSCVFDIVTETVLGKNVDSQKPLSNSVSSVLDTVNDLSGRRGFSPWVWNDTIFRRTKDGKILSKCIDIVRCFAKEAINERERTEREQEMITTSNDILGSDDEGFKSKNFSLLGYLTDLHLKGDPPFTRDDVEEEIHNFFAAGHGTTSATINWMLYMIGLYKDVQRKVHEEIDTVIGEDSDKNITAEDFKNLKYLNCVMKETLRLYPSVPIITRAVDEDTVINGYKVHKGTTVIIPIYMLHRRPEIFPNPEVFDPDRFNEENSQNRLSYIYIPFSAGPRICIGQVVAVHEVLTVVASVLRHFSVTAVQQRDRIKLSFDVLLVPEDELLLKFTKRHHLG